MEEFRSKVLIIWAKIKALAIAKLQKLLDEKKLHPRIEDLILKQFSNLLGRPPSGPQLPVSAPKQDENTNNDKTQARGPTVIIENLLGNDRLKQIKEQATSIFQKFFAAKKTSSPISWPQRLIRYGIVGGIFYVLMDTVMDYISPPAVPVQVAQQDVSAAAEEPPPTPASDSGSEPESVEGNTLEPAPTQVSEKETATDPEPTAVTEMVPTSTPIPAENPIPIVPDVPTVGENTTGEGTEGAGLSQKIEDQPVVEVADPGDQKKTSAPLVEHQQAIAKVSENITPLVEEVKKLPDSLPPNYEILGRGLVYNCEGQHWACVDKNEYIQCGRNKEWASAKGQQRKFQCLPVNVYATNEDCRVVQLYNINMVVPPPKCQPEK